MRHNSNDEQSVVVGFAKGVSPRADTVDRLISESAPAAAEKILLVEDESFVREVAGRVLRSAGYEVTTARTASEAIRIYELCSGNVRLLLSDIILPGLSGIELANALKHRCPSLRVLLMTGYSMQLAEIETGGSQSACLTKPFSAQMLLRKVRHVLDSGGTTVQHGSR